MKTKEELNALKEEVVTLNKKLAELTEEELEQVAGGEEEMEHIVFKSRVVEPVVFESPVPTYIDPPIHPIFD